MSTKESVMTEASRLALLAGLTPDAAMIELETEMIRLCLERNGGNQCRTARDLRMHRNTLKRKIDLSTRLQQAREQIRHSRGWFTRRERQLQLYQHLKPASRERRFDQSRVA